MRVPMSLLVVVTTFALVTSAVAGSAGLCGGDGGNHTTTLTCPEGQYVAAIGARAGAFIDEFSIACREIPVSGNPGRLGNYMSGGPGGGTSSRSGQCGGGGAVWEIWVNSGGYVDKIKTAGCATRGGDNWGDARGYINLDIGGGGGLFCALECPQGEVLYQVAVRHGGWVDSIKGNCRQ